MSEGPKLSVVPGGTPARGRVTIIGLTGSGCEELGITARRALASAGWVAGAKHHLDSWSRWIESPSGRESRARVVPTIELSSTLDEFAHTVAQRAGDDQAEVVVLASGDPGFFGILRPLLKVADRSMLRVLPAPTSVATAFARLGLPWDDTTVVSLSNQSLSQAVGAVRVTRKAAILTDAEVSPQRLGRALVDAGITPDLIAVCARLGYDDEAVTELTSLTELAQGSWDSESVVVLVGPGGLQTVGWSPGLTSTSLPAGAWPGEIGAALLTHLALPPAGVVWDIGPGGGWLAQECVRAQPGLTAFSIPAGGSDDPITHSGTTQPALGPGVHSVGGPFPDSLDRLPDPDRVYLAGSDRTHVMTVVRRLRSGGRIVTATSIVDRATAAADLLGHLSQVSVTRGHRHTDGGWELRPEASVFVAWGPDQNTESSVATSTGQHVSAPMRHDLPVPTAVPESGIR